MNGNYFELTLIYQVDHLTSGRQISFESCKTLNIKSIGDRPKCSSNSFNSKMPNYVATKKGFILSTENVIKCVCYSRIYIHCTRLISLKI